MRRVGALVPVVLLALAACGGDDGDGDAARSTTTDAATPAGTRDTTAPTAPPAEVPLTGTATCADGGADAEGSPAGADLLGVDLTATDDGLTVRFRLAGAVPTTGTTQWSVWARPRGGENVQLAARLDAGAPSSFVYHFADDIQQDVPPEAMVVGTDSVEVAYPTAALASLHAPFDWRAESTVEVEDVDWCPGGADATVLDDQRLPFTG